MEEEFVTWSKQKQQSWLSNLRNNFPSYSLVASIIVKGETRDWDKTLPMRPNICVMTSSFLARSKTLKFATLGVGSMLSTFWLACPSNYENFLFVLVSTFLRHDLSLSTLYVGQQNLLLPFRIYVIFKNENVFPNQCKLTYFLPVILFN